MNLLNQKRGLWAAVLLRCRAAHLLPAGSIAVVGLLAQSSAFAQGNGVLQGKIVDASTKKPLADVVVTATSPALQGEQMVVTDGSGSYRIPNLPPGEYTLRLDRDAYKPYGRGGITMRSSSTIQVNAELLPEQVSLKAEEIVVVGKAPTVDVGSSSTGVSMNQEFTSHLPLSNSTASRSFESLATVAPGAQTDTYGVSIAGTTSPENAFVIDGVSVNNPALGTLGTPLSVEFVKEVSVVSGGYLPEYGRSMGGIFDVVTQSGSNEFHGSVFFNITPGSLEGARAPVRREGTVISTDPSLGSLRDFGVTIGGPIAKDRLWFFGGLQASFARNVLTRRLSALQLDPATGARIKDETGFTVVKPFSTKTYYIDDRTIQYMGKLTYLFNQDHNISVSVSGTPSISGGNGTITNPAPDPINILGPYDSYYASYDLDNANDVSLKYSGAFSNKSRLVDFTFGWHHQRVATLPNDGTELGSSDGKAGIPGVRYRRSTRTINDFSQYENIPAGVCEPLTVGADTFQRCPVTDYRVGGPELLEDSSIDSFQGRLIFTSLFTALGHHVVKAGVDAQFLSYVHTKAISGKTTFREATNGNDFNDYRQYGFLTGPDKFELQNKTTAATSSIITGGFLQDSWQIMDKVTLNVGLRYDTQLMYGSDGVLGLSLPNQWSPRVGVIYDFTQQGRSKIFANYARYYEGVPLDIADRSFPGEVQAGARHWSKSGTPDPNHYCDPTSPDTQHGYNSADCGHGKPDGKPEENNVNVVADNPVYGNNTSNPNRAFQRTGGDKVPVDPDVAAQSSDELVVGGEYEVFPDARVSLSYTRRWLNRAIEDMSRDEATTYFIGNPGFGIASDFPKAVRDYDAITVAFTKAFANTWLAQASYTASWLRGNYAGLFRPETSQLDPNINSDFDLRSLLDNRTGPLPGDRTHQIKLFASKDFLLPRNQDILVGLSFRTQSGSPLNYLGAHAIYGADEVYILPRGSAGRGDWIHNFDVRLGYSIQLSKQSQLAFNIDIFNLFNFQAATLRDQRYTIEEVLPIANGKEGDLKTKLKHPDGTLFTEEEQKEVQWPNFKNPTQFQDPRQFRFGAKVTF